MVREADVLAEARDLAERIVANAPLAVREALRLARSAYDHPESDLLDLNQAASARINHTSAAAEGPGAFAEKRQPAWTGE